MGRLRPWQNLNIIRACIAVVFSFLLTGCFFSFHSWVWMRNQPSHGGSGGHSGPIEIYRSVGPGNTSLLVSGATNALTISGTTATFTSTLPNNVGVGDAVVYGSDSNIAFISARASGTQYTLQAANGAAPAGISGDTSWNIYRAYTSIADAIAGTENSGIPAAMRGYETFTSGANDLVTPNEIWNIALYGDAADTNAANVSGWVTSGTNYLRIYAPYLSTEVGASQRFSGVWDDSKARITFSDVNIPFQIGMDCWIDGIQFKEAVSTVTWSSLVWVDATSAVTVKVSNNILELDNPSNLNENGILRLGSNSAASGTAYDIWNNIVANLSGNNAPGIAVYHEGIAYVYNNTVVNSSANYEADAYLGAIVVDAKNNIAQGCSGASCYATNNGGTYAPTSTNNLAIDSSAPGSSSLNGKTVAFVNYGGFDYRLSPSDTSGALDGGTNLSSDANLAFSADIAAVARPQGTGWDIGASEALASSSSATEMLALTFSSVYNTGFIATATFQGDANSNNSATIYYCDNTTSPGCNPLSGTSAAMTRSAGQFLFSASGLTNSATDTYNVDVVASDTDGVYGSPLSGSVTLLAPPTKIYRSVGPGNNSVLACGGGDGSGCSNNDGNLTISGSTASFASAVPNNIGVGDAIVYDCSGNSSLGAGDCVAFITARASSTSYSVESAAGSTPTAYGASNVWRIYRAYTSLSYTGNANNNENSSILAIDATLGNFDNWTSRDMLANNEQWNFALYADGTDTMPNGCQADYSSWNSTPSNYLRIYTPYLSTEVGASQRHSGVWDSSKAIIDVNYAITINGIYAPGVNIWVDGLQAYAYNYTGGSANYNLINMVGSTGTVQKASNNIFKSDNNVGNGNSDILFVGGGSTAQPSTVKIWNNIIYDLVDGIRGIENYGSGPTTAYLYNNSLYNAAIIANGALSTIAAKNNIVQGASYVSWSGTWDPSSIDNIASDTSAPGSNPINNATVTFVNSAGYDYRLSPSDASGAMNGGATLSADPNIAFNTDIMDMSRPQGTAWDIGASEVLASTSNATETLALTISNADDTTFTAQESFQGDANHSNSATLYYCDSTTSPGCNPVLGTSELMTWATNQFFYSATGLTTGDTYNVDVSVSDSDGIYGPTQETSSVTVEPAISISSISVPAGSPAQFVVNLSAPSSQAVTFHYATSDGTATQPADYTSASGSGTIPAGSTSVTLPNVTTQAAGSGLYFNMALSSLGNASAGTISATASLVASAAPSQVAGLQAVAQSDTRIDLSWNSGGGTTTGYKIAYQTGSNPASCSTGTVISSASINGDEYDITGLTASTAYYFRVCAVNSAGLVSIGVTVNATTLAAAPGTLPPPDVQNLEGNAESTSEVDLAWTSGGGTTSSFQIAYQTGSTAPSSCSSGTLLTTASLTEPITGLTGATTYSFRVCAVDSTDTYFSIGQTITVTTPTQNAITVSNLSASAPSTSSFAATFDYTGDTNNNSTATLYYCDNTNSPGCDPQTSGTSVAMTKSAGVYSVTVTGLSSPINPGDVLNLAAVASDADGVTGSPLTTSVTLVTYQIVFTTQPSNSVTLGSALAQGPAVQVEDSLGHKITSGLYGTGTITLSDTSDNGILEGTVTMTAVNGAATFPNGSIMFERGGTTSLTASMTPTDYPKITGASSAITVTIPAVANVSLFSGVEDPAGDLDGTGTAAKITYPGSMTINGNYIYFVESHGNYADAPCVIRSYDTVTGAVATFAGQLYDCNNVPGAPGTGAVDFNGAESIASDSNYVYFTANATINRVDYATQTIQYMAGGWPLGLVNGNGSSATFNIQNEGNGSNLWVNGTTLYVADTNNCVIRAIDLSNSNFPVSTYAGDGTCASTDESAGTPLTAEFNYPDSVYGDSNYLYVTDKSGIRRIAWSTGNVDTLESTTPLDGMTISGSGIYGAAGGGSQNNLILNFNATTGAFIGDVAGQVFTWGDVDGLPAVSLLGSQSYVLGASSNVYVADTSNDAIRSLNTSTNDLTTLAGATNANIGQADGASTAASFYFPTGAASDGKYLYTLQNAEPGGQDIIRQISLADGSVTSHGSGWGLSFDSPNGLTMIGNTIYFVVQGINKVYYTDTSTWALNVLAGTGASGNVDSSFSLSKFANLQNITAVGDHTLYVWDNDMIKKLDLSTSTVSFVSGVSGSSGCAVGSASTSKYGGGGWSVVYLNGYLYTQTTCNGGAILKVDPSSGTSSIYAGNGTYGEANGTLANAEFGTCSQLSCPMTTDGVNLYLYDYDFGTVREISPGGGNVTTLWGNSSQRWQADGTVGGTAREGGGDGPNWTLYYGYGKFYVITSRGVRVAQ